MSDLPRFFYNSALTENSTVSLDEATAKHIWQVLRMQPGDRLLLTDGKGTIAKGVISSAERHQCSVSLEKVTTNPRKGSLLYLGVCFTKNNSRNEWLLEKATELDVGAIIPILSKRSEKTYFRHERWQKILTSAILQSQQNYLPQLSDIMKLNDILTGYKNIPQKLIAHCFDDESKGSLSKLLIPYTDTILLIGPEGDFTTEEVNLCVENGFKTVSLGAQRLRTETAALTVSAYFNVINDEGN